MRDIMLQLKSREPLHITFNNFSRTLIEPRHGVFEAIEKKRTIWIPGEYAEKP